MGKSMYEVDEELHEKHNTKCNTYEMFPIGARVMNISQCVDFNFFEGNEKGTVIRNRGIDPCNKIKNPSCGVVIRLDEPRHFKGGAVQETFGFDPEDLILLDTSCWPKLTDLSVGRMKVNGNYYQIGHVKEIIRYKWDSGSTTYYAEIELDDDDRREKLIEEYKSTGGKLKEYVKNCYYTKKDC